MTGIPVEDFVSIRTYPKKKYLDSAEIVIAYMKTAANKAAIHGFEGFKLFKSSNLIILTMLNESINTGFVIGYRMHIGGKRHGRWQKIDGFVTTLDKIHPCEQAKIMFGDDPYSEEVIQ